METPHNDLLFPLQLKLTKVLQHWMLTNEHLPAQEPLVVLEDVTLAATRQLTSELPQLDTELRSLRQDVKLAAAETLARKKVLHQSARWVNQWVRAYSHGTKWSAAVVKMPGITEGFDQWWRVGICTQWLWARLAADPPSGPGWPLDRGDGYTQAHFEQEMNAYFAAHDAIRAARLEVRLAEGARALAVAEAVAILKAYGHAARSRLREDSPLRGLIPRLWPARDDAE